ncbi:MAG: response regulator [bacterium]
MQAATETKKILVVDDEADVRTHLTRFLQENGFQTTDAGDGVKAMEAVKKDRPDLITLDMAMPNKSGVKFYREIKEDPELSSIPVIVVTGVTGFGGKSDDFKRFLETRKQVPPPDGFVAKPVEHEELLALVNKLI